MEFISVVENDEDKVKKLSKIASSIIKEYYDSIIGTSQNDYMIEKFQSESAIKEQLSNGCIYFIVRDNENDIGFFGYYKRINELYLSKFYLEKNSRGMGRGRIILDFLINKAKESGLSSITLNVNKYNAAVSIYEKLGFVRIREEKNDIGQGFFMDDFVFELRIS